LVLARHSNRLDPLVPGRQMRLEVQLVQDYPVHRTDLLGHYYPLNRVVLVIQLHLEVQEDPEDQVDRYLHSVQQDQKYLGHRLVL